MTTHAELEANSLGVDESLRRYLDDIRHIPMLTKEQEVELAAQARGGDGDARMRLVQANLRFVVSVAKRYQHRGLSLIDLIAEGNLGLVKAVDHFDETLGYKFISYAVWWIKQAIIQAVYRQARPMRLPYSRANLLFKLERVPRAARTAQWWRRAVDRTLRRKWTPRWQTSRRCFPLAPKVSSLDGTLGDEDLQLLEVLHDERTPGPEETLEERYCYGELADALDGLDEREKNIVERFFGLGAAGRGRPSSR